MSKAAYVHWSAEGLHFSTYHFCVAIGIEIFLIFDIAYIEILIKLGCSKLTMSIIIIVTILSE